MERILFYCCFTIVLMLKREKLDLNSESIFALRPESLLAGFLSRLERLLLGRQCTTSGTGKLWAQINGLVGLSSVDTSQVLLLRLVDDGENAGNVLSEDANLGELRGGTAGNLGDTQVGQLLLQLIKLLQQIVLLLAAQILHLELSHCELGWRVD